MALFRRNTPKPAEPDHYFVQMVSPLEKIYKGRVEGITPEDHLVGVFPRFWDEKNQRHLPLDAETAQLYYSSQPVKEGSKLPRIPSHFERIPHVFTDDMLVKVMKKVKERMARR